MTFITVTLNAVVDVVEVCRGFDSLYLLHITYVTSANEHTTATGDRLYLISCIVDTTEHRFVQNRLNQAIMLRHISRPKVNRQV